MHISVMRVKGGHQSEKGGSSGYFSGKNFSMMQKVDKLCKKSFIVENFTTTYILTELILLLAR